MPTTARAAGDLFAWHRALRGNVSAQALGLALVLSTRMQMDGTIPARFRPGLDRLAAECRFAASSGRRSVSRLITELEDAGFLIVTRGGGRHVVNGYTAALPVPHETATTGVTVCLEAQKEADTVSGETSNGVRGSTHPSPPSPIPSPTDAPTGAGAAAIDQAGTGTPKATNPQPRSALSAADRASANRVVRAVLGRLPHDEADRLLAGFEQMQYRDVMARRIARLVRDGWEEQVILELTGKDKDWSPTPYAGCTNPATAAAGRVRRLDAQLTGRRIDPNGYAPKPRTVGV